LKKNLRFFRKTFKQILNLAKHVHVKFQLSSFCLDGLGQIFDLISRKIQDFLEENLEFSKSKKVLYRDSCIEIAKF
jgi:hypothetical protein